MKTKRTKPLLISLGMALLVVGARFFAGLGKPHN
jgi:hypothetical protein